MPVQIIEIITMKRACYEKYARLRPGKIGMQPIDEQWERHRYSRIHIPRR